MTPLMLPVDLSSQLEKRRGNQEDRGNRHVGQQVELVGQDPADPEMMVGKNGEDQSSDACCYGKP